MSTRPRFDTVLIANRGEIAARILASCHKLGLKAVVVHSTADADAAYVAEADQAICIGAASPEQSYLDAAKLILAAKASGAGAIHPGYGFLSESARFAKAVAAAGLVFVGPPVSAIETMGDKVAAKLSMQAAGIPCVPGSPGALPDDHAAVAAMAEAVGYPVLIKAAGGGGGRGMRVVQAPGELADAVAAAREEADRFFGNAEVYLEKFLLQPRHVEIQVLCDEHGNALWLGDRDCSMQRRHQKVLEESPAPGIDRAAIAAIGESCAEACRRIGYVGAGTFEFLYEKGEFYFIEMNTRLQVEHPVTEMVTGLDIVDLQLRVALGEALDIKQADIVVSGHAIECRINAEHPFSFAPAPGIVETLTAPGGEGVRLDTHLRNGKRVPPNYDSLIAKLIVHAPTRSAAIARMAEALQATEILGILTNIPLHADLIADPGFAAGSQDIHYLGHWLARRAAATAESQS
ncbi:acetyl-CoA carboxylase biotin carboxylase subunit [Devosia sp. A369]